MIYERLKLEFNKNPNWTREKVEQLALELDLLTYQVYKWNWDRRKREGLLQVRPYRK